MADPLSTQTELYESLMKWLENCLAIGGKLDFDPSHVENGTAIADCLVQLVPSFFNPEWRGKIISETGGNWKLKHNNFKKIHRGILDYYHEGLHISLEKFNLPDVSQIAEHGSQADMSRLLQLVLGIAINCEQKDTYIQAIMSMQQDVQHVVMSAIQDLMSREAPSMVTGEDYKELEEEHHRTVEELTNLRAEREQLLQQIHEFQSSLKSVQDELVAHHAETETLKVKLSEAQSSAGITGEAKALQLQRQLDGIKSDKLRIETERDDIKHKNEELELQLHEFLQKNHDLATENEEIPILRDSLEEMKYLETKVKNYESVISQYKKKLEDAQHLKKQLKALEDKSMTYMQQNLDLEEELRRLSGLRTQVDSHKQKLQDIENELAQEKLRCLEASQDAEEKQQTIDSVRMELRQVKSERDQLSNQVPGTPTGLGGSLAMFALRQESPSLDQPDIGLMEAYTPELREQMLRLEKENEILKRRLDSGVESPIPGSSNIDKDSLRKKVAEQDVTVERLQKELMEKKQRLSRLELAAKEYRSKANSLDELRKTKDAEIEKYKKYLNKAKKIIESFGEGKSRAAEDSLEIQTLKTQLMEKEKTIERLEREFSTDRQSWEREERLVVSAWYEMGLMMHRKHSQDRLLSQHGTFLSQQRQALYKKPVPLNTSINISPVSTVGDVNHS